MKKHMGKRENPTEEQTKKHPILRMMQGPFPLDEKYEKLRVLWAVFVLAAAVFCIESISLFLTARHVPGLFVTFFAHPLVFLINLAPLALAAVFLYMLTGLVWPGVILTGIFLIVMTFINIFKILLRGDPFVFSDIFLANEAGDIMQYYSIVFSKSQIACIIVLVIIFILCVLLTGRVRLKRHWILRLLIAAACAGGIAAMVLLVYPKNDLYKNCWSGGDIISRRSDDEWYSAHGFTWAFLHSAVQEEIKVEEWNPETDPISLEPEDEDTVEGIPEDKQVDVIMVQLEAYCDLTDYLDSEAVEEVYTNFHEIEANSIHGNLLDNVNGGGTVDTERSVMTGYTTLPDFTTGTYNSYIWYLRSCGYTTEGSHPGNDWFYDRDIINENLGFENYWFSENMYEQYVDADAAPYESDDILFTKLIEMEQESTEPYFSVNISYQNHGPYTSSHLKDGAEERVTAEECSNEVARNIVNNYLYQISITDQALKTMTDTLNASEKPVVVVMFGDHKPYLGNYTDLDTWQELGINVDVSSDEGFYNFYSTPYFIWANDAAKAVLGTDCVGEGGDFGSCFLMNKLFEVCGWGGDILMQASNALMKAGVTMVHSAVDVYYENGELTDTLSEEGAAALSRFLSVQAYWQKHFQYEDLWDGGSITRTTEAGVTAADGVGQAADSGTAEQNYNQNGYSAGTAGDTGGTAGDTGGSAEDTGGTAADTGGSTGDTGGGTTNYDGGSTVNNGGGSETTVETAAPEPAEPEPEPEPAEPEPEPEPAAPEPEPEPAAAEPEPAEQAVE